MIVSTLDRILHVVAMQRRVSAADLAGHHREFAHARQEVMYLARRLTALSLPQIARRLHRDHTTVLFAVRAVEKRMRNSPQLAAEVDAMAAAVRGMPAVGVPGLASPQITAWRVSVATNPFDAISPIELRTLAAAYLDACPLQETI